MSAVKTFAEKKKLEALEELDFKHSEEEQAKEVLRSIEIDDYRFIETKRDHIHQKRVKGVWKNLVGVSSVVKNITNFQVAAYYGARRTLMDFSYDPKEAKDEVTAFRHVMSELLTFDDQEVAEALYDSYKAHATYSKERADLGTDRHAEVDAWIKKCIAENNGYPMPSESPVIKKFIELTKHREPRFIASEKHGYNDELWIGGIADVIVETNIGLGIWDNKNRPMIYGKDLIQMGGYTHLFPMEFTHVMGIPLEGDEVRTFYDVPQLKKVFANQLEVYKFMRAVDPDKN